MTRTLQVDVNRSDHHEVSTRTKRFVPEGPFEVHVRNHGEGSHVHVSVAGDLAVAGGPAADNPFLEAGETLEVPVDVTTDLRPARGSVEVTTGYGRNQASIDVEVRSSSADSSASSTATASDATGSGSDPASTAQSPAADDAGAAADAGAIDGAVTAVADRWTAAVGALRERSPSVRDGEASGDDGPTVALPARPSFDVASALLVALTLLALLAAGTALRLFSGPVVTASVLAVVATVVGAGAYLLLD